MKERLAMKESDLYLPLKQFLESQGYEVKGEVQNCDVVAVRGEESPVVVELKLSLNLDVVLQAVERLSLSPQVYVGVPLGCGALKRRRRQIIKLLRMLGLGLLAIAHETDARTQNGNVKILLDPRPYKPRQSKQKQGRLLGEFTKRVGDPNLGGTAMRKGLMTAYRQRAIRIAEYLREHGPTKASAIAKALEEPKARDIMYKNVYGWFDRVALGQYALSPRGVQESLAWQERIIDANSIESLSRKELFNTNRT